MKNLVSQENIKTVVVSAVLHGTWELIFTETVSSTPENVKASFKRHQMNHFTVLHGTVDGCLGTERFNSFETLFAILDEYENDPGPPIPLCA